MIKKDDLLKKLRLMPKGVIFLLVLISFSGVVLMHNAEVELLHIYIKKQIIYFALFFPLMIFVALINPKIIFSAALYTYMFSILLLLIGTLVGYKAMGATRWISIGFFRFQPSELVKIGTVLLLAKYFYELKHNEVNKVKFMIIPSIIILVPFFIVLKQPDLGTAMILGMVGIVMFYLTGIKIWKFALALMVFIVSTPLLWERLHEYQKKRILIFLNPELDPLGSGYNIIQSKISIGSGGLFGKDKLESTQAKLNFLPEYQTDFIFSLFAEKFGFIGAIFLLLLFMILIVNVFYIGANCKSQFGKFVILGLISIFALHVIINVCMVIGLLPVVGIPLPLVSSGGSSMGSMFIAFGIIINIKINNNVRFSRNKLGYIY